MFFFSVIIPTYNRSNFIVSTLKSIQNQSFQNWECLIVDDGSIDNTSEVVKSISKLDNRFKYIYQENAERSVARNNGIRNSQGKYICFLDSDDTYENDHLEKLYHSIKDEQNETFYFTNFNFIEGSKKEISKVSILSDDVIHYLCYNPIIPARTCIHSEILKNIQFDDDIVVVEDLILWLKIVQEYPIKQLDFNTVNYHLHEDNSVNLKNTGYQKRLDGLIKFKKRYTNIWNKIEKADQEYLIGNTYFGIAKHFIAHNKKSKAILYLLKSILIQKKHSQLKHKLFLIKELLLGYQVEKYIN